MHRRTVLVGLFTGAGLAGASAALAAQSQDDGPAGLITVTDAEGNPMPTSPGPFPSAPREQRRQYETPEQLQRRAEYVEHLSQQHLSDG
ncbi:hypothetical protein [Streptomyces arboris]|uniref:hypothetical protein n=1 Tax=Streptomyces arboris TaxID=2600619 RepID=UPI003C2DE557